MTLLWADGFEGYDIDNASAFWDSVDIGSSVISATGRRGGNALYKSSAYNDVTLKIFKSIAKTDYIITGCAFKINKVDNYDNFLAIYEVGSAQGIAVSAGLTEDLVLIVKSTGSAVWGQLQWITDKVIQLGTWYYVELKVILSNTVGEIICRLNEEEVVNATGLDNSGYDGTQVFGGISLRADIYRIMWFDDVYLADSTGSINNDFLGDIRVDAIHPNGAGNYAQFTPSAGANYECIDEVILDDTDYVSHLTVGEKDSYTYPDVPTDIDDASIFGIHLMNQGKRTAAADNIKMKGFLRTGSTDYEEATAQSMEDNNKAKTVLWELDPSDAGIWTQAKINACEFGMEVN